jgi:hypothetical protein
MGVVRLTDKKQMQELLQSLGFDWNLNDMMAVYRKMDLDHNDSVDFREFYQWYVCAIVLLALHKRCALPLFTGLSTSSLPCVFFPHIGTHNAAQYDSNNLKQVCG